MISAATESALPVLAACLHFGSVAWLLLEERRQPSATMAWLMAFVFLPGVGQAAYFLFGRSRAKYVAEDLRQSKERVRSVLASYDALQNMRGIETGTRTARTDSMLDLGERLASLPASFGNQVHMLVDAACTYGAIRKGIEEARNHVHVCFYIIQPDETGKALRDLLVRKAREGVHVRVLADGVGSFKLPDDFWAELEKAGGEARLFRPMRGYLLRVLKRDRVDFRNHRKIVICDGKLGFTGGINVGREYLGLDPEIGAWRDTHVSIEGPAVLGMQTVFLQDWLTAGGEGIEDPALFPDNRSLSETNLRACGICGVQLVPSGPDREWSPIEYLHVQAFALAKERIWITNPYFVPSKSVLASLMSASLRGVDVRVMLPRKADHRIVAWAAQSYFPDLLRAGVRIFEYRRGFVHAKTMVVDDWLGSVGSANMDLRSFHLNWELNAFVFGEEFAHEMAEQYLLDLEGAEEVLRKERGVKDVPMELLRLGARLAAPVL